MGKGKNGKIELLRFVFCVLIVCAHINVDYPDRVIMINDKYTFFKEGGIGVEFFFIVTGCLTAMGIYKSAMGNKNEDVLVGKSTLQFMYRKICTIFPYHIMVVLLTVAYRTIILHKGVLMTLLNGLPNALFLDMFGFAGWEFISVEWYISAMLIALLAIYPLCLKFYDVFARIIAPLLGFLLIGIITYVNGSIIKVHSHVGFMYSGLLRAVGEILIGIFIFELVRILGEREVSAKEKAMTTIMEILVYCFIFLYVVAGIDRKFSASIMLLIAIGVGLSFSEISYGQNFFQNKLFYFLGRLSLPMYLGQNLVRTICKRYFGDMSTRHIAVFVLAGSFLFGLFLLMSFDCVKKLTKEKKLKSV